MGIPTGDETLAPLLGDDLARSLDHGARQGAQRVAVEIDRAIRQREAVAEGGERIGAVKRLGIGEGHGTHSIGLAEMSIDSFRAPP